jgi:hypothetical protein
MNMIRPKTARSRLDLLSYKSLRHVPITSIPDQQVSFILS